LGPERTAQVGAFASAAVTMPSICSVCLTTSATQAKSGCVLLSEASFGYEKPSKELPGASLINMVIFEANTCVCDIIMTIISPPNSLITRTAPASFDFDRNNSLIYGTLPAFTMSSIENEETKGS